MSDSMQILDTLRERGYVPQDDARPGEGWFDKVTPGGRLRVILTGWEVKIHALDGAMAFEWAAKFSDDTPRLVVLAALDAAEADPDDIDCGLLDEDGGSGHDPITEEGGL